MKINRRQVLLSILVILLLGGYFYVVPILRTATAYAAKQACSCHFLQGRELEEISEHDLNFSVLSRVSLKFNEDYDGVEARLFGLFKREARFVNGYGCISINDKYFGPAGQPSAGGLPELSPLPLAGGEKASNVMNFSPDWDSIFIDTNRLSAAIDYGMAPVAGGGARAVLVFQDGQLIGERYAPGYDERSLLAGWSMTKTITALLVGQQGLDPESTHLFPEWENDERREISLENLLRMESGLDWEEAYGSMTDAIRMLFYRSDFAAYTAGKARKYAPAEHWAYSSGTTNLLMRLYLESFPDKQTGIDAIYSRLFYPIGAYSFRIEPDQSGQPVGSSYGWATARDWGRVGQLMLQNGRWGEEQIVPAEWIDYIRQPAPSCPDGDYGGQTWLKGPDMPSLPENAFLLRGFQDQRVIVIPDDKLVIVRLGHNDDKSADFDGLVSRVLEVLE